jgi:hypothetical protein
MGKLIATVGVGLMLYGVYSIVAGIVGLCIFVPAMVIMLPGYLKERRMMRGVIASADATLEKNRQWMRDNGRADEITW